MFRGYTLRYDDLFVAQAEQIAAPKDLDDALTGVEWVLSNQPEICPIVPSTKRLRIIKTVPYRRGLVMIPPLRIWFSIEEGGIVLLRSIEVVEDWDTPEST